MDVLDEIRKIVDRERKEDILQVKPIKVHILQIEAFMSNKYKVICVANKHIFKQNDCILLNNSIEGIVYKTSENKLELIIKQILEITSNVALSYSKNNISYKRIYKTLDSIQKIISGNFPSPYTLLSAVFTGNLHNHSNEPSCVTFLNPNLNASQQNAVLFSLRASHFALIHGPPGTGKTHTLLEIVQQLLLLNKRILITGPSNISVDNLIERLLPFHSNIIRIGHPARCLPSILHTSLDHVLFHHDNHQLLMDIRSEITSLLRSLPKASSRKHIYAQIKSLKREYKEREDRVLHALLGNTPVICATLNTAASKILRNTRFDVVIIDEATQSLEAESLVGCLIADKIILAGDPMQLPPTLLSKENADISCVSLFDRLLRKEVCVMLDTQYRGNADILGYSSVACYEGKMKADESVANNVLIGLGVEEDEWSLSSVVWLDTLGRMPERAEDGKVGEEIKSRYNPGEVDKVHSSVEKLIGLGVKEEWIAVISPYSAQVKRIKEKLSVWSGVEVGTVDGFQGREKQVIVLSLVRSNEQREIGFLKDVRRLNVAVTRAKRLLLVVGDSECVASNPWIKGLYEWIEGHGLVEYVE